MNRLLTTLFAGAAMFGTVSAANATTISGGSASINSTLTDYTTNLVGSLTKFNTSLGTLNDINITFSYGFNSVITVLANSNASGDTQTKSGAAFSSTDSAIQAVLNALVNTTFTAVGTSTLNPSAYTLFGADRLYTQTAGTQTAYNSNVATVTTTVQALGSQLTPFEDSLGSAFTIGASTLTGTTGSTTGGNATITQQTFANQSFSISYDYTPPAAPTGVPEPASMALLGAGLLGAGLVRRRSSK